MTLRLSRFLVLAFLSAALFASTAAAQTPTHNLGPVDGTVYQRGTLTTAQPAVSYWFYVRYSGTDIAITVQDFGGRLIDEASLYNASASPLSTSRNRIGATLGARRVGAGWYRLYIRSSKNNHQYGVTIKTTRAGEPADVGNNFNTAHDLGSIGSQPKAYPNSIGPGDSADFYRFRVTNSSNFLEISLAQARRGGAFLELYRLDGSRANFVARATATGSNSPIMARRVQGGTYFARVTGASATTGPQGTSYRIVLRSRPAAADPGGDFSRPWRIGIPTGRRPINEQVTPQIDGMDVYEFNVPSTASGTFRVRVTVTGSNGDFSIYLVQGRNNFLANDTSKRTQKVLTRALSAGSHRVMVLSNGYQVVNYQLAVETQSTSTSNPTPAPVCTPTESSNSQTTACIVYATPTQGPRTPQVSQSVGGPTDPADWFLVQSGCNIPSRRPVIRVDRSTAAVNFAVNNQLGQPIAFTPSGNAIYFRVPRGMAAYVQITSASGAPVPYTATFRRWGCQ